MHFRLMFVYHFFAGLISIVAVLKKFFLFVRQIEVVAGRAKQVVVL